jgi:diaminopimelate decarboxylase
MAKTSFLSKSSARSLIHQFGSPLYVYNGETIQQRCRELKNAFSSWKKTQFYYAMKANSNLHILRIIKEEAYNLDCVSLYEVELGLLAGFSPKQILFTVNNMSDEEMHFAHKKGVLLNIDSLSRLEKYGNAYPHSAVCLRLTPEVTAGHHAKVQTGYKESKFGILFEEVSEARALAKKFDLDIIGLHEHTGSGIPARNMNRALQSIKGLMHAALQFPDLQFLDFGGGFPIPYTPNEKRLDLKTFGEKVIFLFSTFCKKYKKELALHFEPGRYCVAEAGILLCTVTTIKNRGKKSIVGVDTGFNHLVRPVMYDSYHHIVNLSSSGKMKKYDVYGNICESGDCFGKGRMIAEVHEGDILAILDTGAYGFSMASQYNSRPLPTEVLLSTGKTRLIRKRQTFEDIVNGTVKN